LRSVPADDVNFAGAIVCGGGIVKVLELIDRRMTKWLGLIGALA
jgi:hypothetical protein